MFGGSIKTSSLNMVNYSNGKFPYPMEKLYSEFHTPRAVQSGKSPTLSEGGGGGLRVSLDGSIRALA